MTTMNEVEVRAAIAKVMEASKRGDNTIPTELLSLVAQVIIDLHRIADAVERRALL